MKAYSTNINVCLVANNDKEARDILRKQMQKFTDKVMRKTATRGFLGDVSMKNLFNLGLVQQCAAEDCSEYFVPVRQKQRFCSKTCYHRIRKRIERVRKKEGLK